MTIKVSSPHLFPSKVVVGNVLLLPVQQFNIIPVTTTRIGIHITLYDIFSTSIPSSSSTIAVCFLALGKVKFMESRHVKVGRKIFVNPQCLTNSSN
jgi:hypothetical protein